MSRSPVQCLVFRRHATAGGAHVFQAGKGTCMLAYLDANSGSLLIQAIVAGAAGVAVFFKFGWRRITAPFRSRRPRS
jgi:hypothetical protein